MKRLVDRGLAGVMMVGLALCATCTDKPGPDDGTSTLHLALAFPPGMSDVVGVRFEVESADGTVQSNDVPLEEEPLPEAANPDLAGHAFADWFVVLNPGPYQVRAQPLGADGNPSQVCSLAQASATVIAGATTEVMLVSDCSSGGSGGLDTTLVFNRPPFIQDLKFDDSKFVCIGQPAAVQLVAIDPDGDDVEVSWAVATAPEDVTGNRYCLSADGGRAAFSATASGRYELAVTVSDGRTSASLTFPVFISDCGQASQCPGDPALAVQPSPPGETIGRCVCTPGDDLSLETPRVNDVPPLESVLQAVSTFQASDPDASFTFFNGRVDSFATTAKETVPGYALPILQALGLSTTPRAPLRLPAPILSTTVAKPSRNLDANLAQAQPILPEAEDFQLQAPGENDPQEDQQGDDVPVARPTEPAENPQQLVAWQRPSDALVKQETQAALPILEAFLVQNRAVFEVSPGELDIALRPRSYEVGAYFRKASYDLYYGDNEKVLYGLALVHFDANWNVIGVSRQIVTPQKLAIGVGSAPPVNDVQLAIAIASGAYPRCLRSAWRVKHAEAAVDVIRKRRVWDVQLSDDEQCNWRTVIDRTTGEVLNVSDETMQFTDAEIRRWYFSDGDPSDPRQMISTGVYTRNDRRLEHDFFWVMNDHRCEGAAEGACGQTSHSSLWCNQAYTSYNGASYIRATRRTGRDWVNYYPSGSSETFGETNAYWWARSFSQWLKSSLDALGVLPSGASNYHRVVIITNACSDNSYANSSFTVSTDDDKGEGGNVIRLRHRDPSGSFSHNASCEGGGCFDSPGNIAHELNHFFLSRYYGVGSGLDCGGSNQLKFTHEGILGTAVPQAHWHYYYGVGYNPPTDKLYFSHTNIGRVHTSDSNRLKLSDYWCADYVDDPYRWGRPVGQALWEFFHGKKVTGSTIGGTWYPSTDKDFNMLAYWAADLQAASTYKDRYEFANRFMEILDKHSNWSSGGKQDYCDIFDHHELDNFVNADYCD